MMAGFAMLILALGALVMVLCTGFGDDEEHGDVTDQRRDDVRPPDVLPPGTLPSGGYAPGVWSPEGDASLRRLRGRGFRLR
ncbi:MAG: hypothetical protein GEU97_03790 [Actinophytocola sp.]|nr:hypothetical protein [Actinophytocola sp.]